MAERKSAGREVAQAIFECVGEFAGEELVLVGLVIGAASLLIWATSGSVSRLWQSIVG